MPWPSDATESQVARCTARHSRRRRELIVSLPSPGPEEEEPTEPPKWIASAPQEATQPKCVALCGVAARSDTGGDHGKKQEEMQPPASAGVAAPKHEETCPEPILATAKASARTAGSTTKAVPAWQDGGRSALTRQHACADKKAATSNFPAFSETDIDNMKIHSAATIGDVDLLQKLLDKQVDPDIRDEFGATPLEKACTSGHVSCAELLLERGAKAKGGYTTPATPLHRAALNNGPTGRELVRLLLRHGADPFRRNTSGWTAAEAALKAGFQPPPELAERGSARI